MMFCNYYFLFALLRRRPRVQMIHIPTVKLKETRQNQKTNEYTLQKHLDHGLKLKKIL